MGPGAVLDSVFTDFSATITKLLSSSIQVFPLQLRSYFIRFHFTLKSGSDSHSSRDAPGIGVMPN